MDDLARLRQSVDDLDEEIVAKLQQRARLAQQIGKLKTPGALRHAAREAEVLEHVKAVNSGPFSDQALTTIYTTIIAACRAVQE